MSSSPERIAVSVVGTENLDLMVRIAGATASHFGGTITFLNILPLEYTAAQKTHTDKIFGEAIKRHTGKALYKTEVLASDDPLGLLVEHSKDFDLSDRRELTGRSFREDRGRSVLRADCRALQMFGSGRESYPSEQEDTISGIGK